MSLYQDSPSAGSVGAFDGSPAIKMTYFIGSSPCDVRVLSAPSRLVLRMPIRGSRHGSCAVFDGILIDLVPGDPQQVQDRVQMGHTHRGVRSLPDHRLR